jgi:hypothetical protein
MFPLASGSTWSRRCGMDAPEILDLVIVVLRVLVEIIR